MTQSPIEVENKRFRPVFKQKCFDECIISVQISNQHEWIANREEIIKSLWGDQELAYYLG